MKRILIILITAVTALSLSGCSELIDSLISSYDSEREIKWIYGRDGTTYVMSENTTLFIDAHKYADTNSSGWDNLSYLDNTVLHGYFDCWAWDNFTIFIVCGGTFYTFALKGAGNGKERLKKYTESELAALYPDYKSYDWGSGIDWVERKLDAKQKYPELVR